jgi:hypothetical protein
MLLPPLLLSNWFPPDDHQTNCIAYGSIKLEIAQAKTFKNEKPTR